ncbi:MAG: hypothetical protein RBU30_11915 [Polyangia bacterium]|jgi:hypothetical protein|nr:hypothetical protein [Polyangia bacterium]
MTPIFGRALRFGQAITTWDGPRRSSSVIFSRDTITSEVLRACRGLPLLGPEHAGPQVGTVDWVEADRDGLRFAGRLYHDALDLPKQLSIAVDYHHPAGQDLRQATRIDGLKHIALCEAGCCSGTWWRTGRLGQWPDEPLPTPVSIALMHARREEARRGGTHG